MSVLDTKEHRVYDPALDPASSLLCAYVLLRLTPTPTPILTPTPTNTPIPISSHAPLKPHPLPPHLHRPNPHPPFSSPSLPPSNITESDSPPPLNPINPLCLKPALTPATTLPAHSAVAALRLLNAI